ncbi:MAG: hypothetical protein ACYS1C_06540 [Planctomycetota bacterium]|jgi:hypothetical protein
MSTQQAEQTQKERGAWRWVLGGVVALVALLLIPAVRLTSGQDWSSDPMIATYILAGVILAAELAVIVMLKTARTRYSVERQILEHREVHEYVILWNRPRWILYTPTMVVSVLFGLYLYLHQWGLAPQAVTPRMLGGVWVVLAVLNVLVEQFHMSIKVVLIIVPTLGAVLLVLHLVGYADEAIRLLRYAAVDVPPKLYFASALAVGLIIFLGWVHGLFHYMAITPNVADLQRGLTETGRQIKNADYDVDFDATDVVERWLFGFGRIIISFRDPNKPPMVFFVPRASVVDERTRRVRSVTVIDHTPDLA